MIKKLQKFQKTFKLNQQKNKNYQFLTYNLKLLIKILKLKQQDNQTHHKNFSKIKIYHQHE
jgi:hypothetical protein